MKTYLLDGSVVLCLLLEEQSEVVKHMEKLFSAAATRKVQLLSSFLLPLEVGNGLRFTIKNTQLADATYRAFFRLPITLVELTKAQYVQAVSLAYSLRTTVYDTSYHVLARMHRATFLTCDHAYFQKAKKLGSIELLGT